jgi:UDP-glucose 4-epimerase
MTLMKCLVTGSEGYIGQNLVSELKKRNFQVVPYDIKIDRDILDKKILCKYMKSCEVVFHLAAISSVQECEKDLNTAYKVNVIGTRNVCETASKYRVKIVYASSFAVKSFINFYGLTKFWGENDVLKHDGIVLRYSNVYGGKNYLKLKSSVIAKFVSASINNETTLIYGNGKQTRDFVHVSDVVNGTILAVKAESGVYEICMGKSTTILDLVKMFDVKFKFVEERKVDIKHSKGSFAKAFMKFGYKPRMMLEEGVKTLQNEN